MLKSTEKQTIIICPNLAIQESKIYNGKLEDEHRLDEQDFCNKFCAHNRKNICQEFIKDSIDSVKSKTELIKRRNLLNQTLIQD